MTELGDTILTVPSSGGPRREGGAEIMPKNASTKTAASASTPKPTKKSPSERSKTKKAAGAANSQADSAIKATAGKSTATRTTKAKAVAKKSASSSLPIPEGTEWSPDELAEVRAELEIQVSELRAEYDRALVELSNLQQTSNDGAGDDQADAGTKTFEREQEMSIAHNRLDLLTQMERAIVRIDAGTYGRCESCGNPIAKARLQAFPSATLCVQCKQREERR